MEVSDQPIRGDILPPLFWDARYVSQSERSFTNASLREQDRLREPNIHENYMGRDISIPPIGLMYLRHNPAMPAQAGTSQHYARDS